jgi:hypothetical protein
MTPGVASSSTIPSVTILGGAGFVDVSGTITATPAVTDQATGGGAVTEASATLTNWLFVDLDVTVPGGTSVNLHLDYGRLAATAGYDPAS